jgi:alginate O-acetyltransferase complex protein AlgI
MIFTSAMFVCFLLLVFLGFVCLPEKWRKLWLLAASYYFYGCWSVSFISVILLSTTMDYWLSHLIEKNPSVLLRRIALSGGCVFNLLILGYFKYTNFFLASLHSLAHRGGYSLALPQALAIILPLGISFYTFEAISYLIDVYRGKAAARNWLDYNFYIMYFPHLISGPIIRFADLWPQYAQTLKLPSLQRLRSAVELIVLGYLFKVLIADNAALIADPVFQAPANFSGLKTLLGTLAFTVQIYFDFMGYTHIARGVSLLFNIQLPLNFNHPYSATNISNFWERWHISLSRWIRDYLYFPLGGSRVSQAKTCFNLLLVMLVAGAWHGAGWHYILWGGYHGVLLAGYHLYQTMMIRLAEPLYRQWTQAISYRLFSQLLTFALVVIGWVLFRAASLKDIGLILSRLNPILLVGECFHAIQSSHLTLPVNVLFLLIFCLIGLWLIQKIEVLYRPLPFWAKAQVAFAALILCWLLSGDSIKPFIYFQF